MFVFCVIFLVLFCRIMLELIVFCRILLELIVFCRILLELIVFCRIFLELIVFCRILLETSFALPEVFNARHFAKHVQIFEHLTFTVLHDQAKCPRELYIFLQISSNPALAISLFKEVEREV